MCVWRAETCVFPARSAQDTKDIEATRERAPQEEIVLVPHAGLSMLRWGQELPNMALFVPPVLLKSGVHYELTWKKLSARSA